MINLVANMFIYGLKPVLLLATELKLPQINFIYSCINLLLLGQISILNRLNIYYYYLFYSDYSQHVIFLTGSN